MAHQLSARGAPNWRGPYLKKAVPLDPWGRAYSYASPGEHRPTGYDLGTLGRDGQPGGGDDDAAGKVDPFHDTPITILVSPTGSCALDATSAATARDIRLDLLTCGVTSP